MRENRGKRELRPIEILPGYLIHPLGSCFVKWGNTWVICSVRQEERVPPFLQGTGKGWITAEYGMLPGSTDIRISRDQHLGGRSQEIRRMIGRSLRGVMDFSLLGERTLRVDCDVIQADGGTRVASVVGGFVALIEALSKLHTRREISSWPLREFLGAVSVGKLGNEFILDLDYSEDSQVEVDMNVVMTESKKCIEIQATGEEAPFSPEELSRMLEIAWEGIEKIISLVKEVTLTLWKGRA